MSVEEDLMTQELWCGNEDNYDVIVIPWKAAATSKYDAKELYGPIAY